MPHAVTCAILGVSVSWFYKWVDREPTTEQRPPRRARRRGAGRVRGVAGAPTGRRGSMPICAEAGWHGEREHGRRLDAPARACRAANRSGARD